MILSHRQGLSTITGGNKYILRVFRRDIAMDKEEFRTYVMREDPIPTMTPEEAFEAGKRGDLSGYDAASRACARAIISFAERHSDRWKRIQDIYSKLEGISDGMKRQDIVIEGIKLLHELADDELTKTENEIGPTGYMWSWAVMAAITLTEKPIHSVAKR